jgi:protein involved in sex pheromone biosynthesis
LRLIDDEKQIFTPDYSIGALDRREKLGGSHESLAFVQVKNFKQKQSQEEEIDPKVVEKLKAEGKRMLQV